MYYKIVVSTGSHTISQLMLVQVLKTTFGKIPRLVYNFMFDYFVCVVYIQKAESCLTE
jgi:hypothetical protein